MLGAQRVMINQGAQGGTANVMPNNENKVYGIPALKTMADYGKSKGIIVSVETRGAGGGGPGTAGRRTCRHCWFRTDRCGTTVRAVRSSGLTTAGNAQALPRPPATANAAA